MPLQFDQTEVEKEFEKIVDRDDRADIAKISQIYPSVIYGMFNADDERKSFMFGVLQIACALDDIDCGRGEAFWMALSRFRELSKKRKPQDSPCVSSETGNLNKEVADVVSAHLEGKTFYDQLKEVDEVVLQAERTKHAIMCAIDKERELLAKEYKLRAA